MPPPAIRIDPFFDGDGGTTRRQLPEYAPAANTVPAADIVPATNTMPAGYHDVRHEQLADGRAALSVMRPGPEGLVGTVIPPATMGGVPRGVRPHATRDMEVNIDPHVRGQETRVRLGDVTEASIQAAEQYARQVTPDPYDVPTARLRASAVFHGVAANAAAQHQNAPQRPVTEPVTMPQPPGNIPAERLAYMANGGQYQQPQAPRVVRPLQAFVGQPAAPAPAVHASPSPPPPEYAAANPPRRTVTFEIEHFGVHRARYHDVVLGPGQGFLVLVFDTRYQGGEMYVPPSGDDAPPMALHVEGADQVHLVHTTGIMYSYGGYSFCVLLIERSVPADAME